MWYILIGQQVTKGQTCSKEEIDCSLVLSEQPHLNEVHCLNIPFQWPLSCLLLSGKLSLADISTYASVIIRVKVPRMHFIGGQSKVGEHCFSLPPYHCIQQPGTFSLEHSSLSVIWMCKASFTGSSCSLSCSRTSFQSIGWWLSHICCMLLQSCLQSLFGLLNVDL